MSVIASQRGESQMQFIETARLLEEETLAYCMKAPKRYSAFLTGEIMTLAGRVHSYVLMANSVYITNKTEFELRRNYFNKANSCLQALNPKINLLYSTILKSHSKDEKYKWIHNAMKRWCELMNREAELISKIKKSDKERHKAILKD
jgi:hypothetical protein